MKLEMRKRVLMVSVMLLLLPPAATAQGKGTATFTGTVVDSVQRAIAGAEVSFPDLAIAKLTDEKGVFRLTDIPAGNQRVIVRRIGFGQLDTVMVFRDNQTIERRVTLGRVAMLDSVVVAGEKPDRELADFEANRARGFGRFVTRAELDKIENQSLSSVVQGLQGLGVMRGTTGQSWVTARRSPMTRCPGGRPAVSPAEAAAMQRITDDCLRSERLYYVPEDHETRQGMKRACYSLVYVDRGLMNSGTPTPPFDLNTIQPTQLQGIEWYETTASLPSTYSTGNARCGVLVLHMRRGR